MTDFNTLFQSFAGIKVGVVGDVMLDTYIWGHVERISPEAPVPVVSLHHKEQRIGGAGNVALNLQSLGAQAFIITATGDDDEAQTLNHLFTGQHINTTYSIRCTARITTNKTRVISRNQQMMRLDAEITADLKDKDEENILDRFRQFVEKEKPQIVILEDYNKGVLSAKVIAEVISICKEHNILTAVDPKRKNFFAYKGVDIFKPNLKEVRDALNIIVADAGLGHLQEIHASLQKQLYHRISFITLSEFGVFYQEGNNSAIIPSHLRNIADVSGAGDTVIAVAALAYAATKDVHTMAEIANIAGGLVCEEVGTAVIKKDVLLRECQLLLP